MSASPQSAAGSATILIVDDELPITDIVAEVLGEEGFTTLVALGGEHAIELLASGKADLMLLDLYMPGLSGLDVLNHLRANGALDQLPVIVMTAGTVDSADLSRLGAARVLAKPFEVDVLIDTVKALL
jgi:DNA-binding response OmpR family regulator